VVLKIYSEGLEGTWVRLCSTIRRT